MSNAKLTAAERAKQIVDDYEGRTISRLHASTLEVRIWQELTEAERAGAEAMREACAKKIDEEANSGRQCSPKNEAHDPRWCSTCDVMQDMAFVLLDKVITLPLPGGGGQDA